MLPWKLSEVSVTSAVICKQRLLHEYEIVKYLQNCKYQDINAGRFRKHLQVSIKTMENNYPMVTHTFFTGIQFLATFALL